MFRTNNGYLISNCCCSHVGTNNKLFSIDDDNNDTSISVKYMNRMCALGVCVLALLTTRFTRSIGHDNVWLAVTGAANVVAVVDQHDNVQYRSLRIDTRSLVVTLSVAINVHRQQSIDLDVTGARGRSSAATLRPSYVIALLLLFRLQTRFPILECDSDSPRAG